MKIPKVAGTSILRSVLEKEIEDISHKRRNEEQFNKWYASTTKEQLQQYFSFTFVRNPWDKMVSLYHYFRSKTSSDISFRQFITEGKFKCSKYHETISMHSLPQHHYLNFVNLSFIGKYESLEEDWKYVASKIGVPDKLPHSNRSKHDHYTKYYDQETIEMVRKEYQKDIEILGYKYKEQ